MGHDDSSGTGDGQVQLKVVVQRHLGDPVDGPVPIEELLRGSAWR
ncbi:hypothetical protein ABZS93_12840 [Streptomyces sp900116325]